MLASLLPLPALDGAPAFRQRQVLEWILKKRATTSAQMTNLPLELREALATAPLRPLERMMTKQSSDTTEKLLLRCADGSLIETVLIRAPQPGVGLDDARVTVCISTQVGCAYGCRFCASGLAGWKRDLSTMEILGQFLEVCRLMEGSDGPPKDGRPPFDNVVIMGMGEPLANYDHLLPALAALNADWGLNFGARRITISTSGLVPQIRRLADEGVSYRLAVSLHGATDAVREQIMPINRKYPLAQLLPAIRYFSDRHAKMVTLEFILIEEVNDSLEQADALAEIASELHAHVNLIPYNTVPGLPWKRPNLKRQETFGRVLRDAGVSFTLRREKGHAIEAACGQLRLQQEQSEGTIGPVPAKAHRLASAAETKPANSQREL